jgi:TetR/AcrR family transcriptional regulator, regulator of biofilm formation and stress response
MDRNARAPDGTRLKKERPERGEGREALYGALARVVARDGFDGVTFRSVAEEAGVTHGLASYHFGTREAMIHEALSWAVGHSIASSQIAPHGGSISEFAGHMPGMLRESPEEAIFQFELLLRALRSPGLRDEVRKSYDDYMTAVADSLRSFGIDDPALARLVFGALDGLTLQQLLYQNEDLTNEAITALRRVLALAAASQHGARGLGVVHDRPQ